MGRRISISIMCLALLLTATAVSSGQMVVPVNRELPVSGNWAVKYMDVQISVRDQVASVVVDQQFYNTGNSTIEVEYFLPLPADAAVSGMTLVVDGKEMAGVIMQADEARKIYEGIVRTKKDPALLEYCGQGLYRTRAFPLEPGKPAQVIVKYDQILRKDTDLVEVGYPLDGGKYSSKAIERITITVDAKSNSDITNIYSPTHELDVKRPDARSFKAVYEVKGAIPTSDLLVYYKARDEAVGATLLAYQSDPNEDGYFMILASPSLRHNFDNGRVMAKDIVFVIDRSGSMSSDGKLQQAKEALNLMLKNLNSDDQFNIVIFDDAIEPTFDTLVAASAEKVAEAAAIVDRLRPSGSTNIHAALLKALAILGTDNNDTRRARPQYIIFLTDGLPESGVRDIDQIIRDTTAANKTRARIFALGVGYDVNVKLLDKLVKENGGTSDYVKKGEPLEAKATRMYAKIQHPVMTNLKVTLKDVTMQRVYPQEAGDLFEGGQIVMVGRFRAQDVSKLGSEGRTQLEISGNYGGQQRTFSYPVSLTPSRRAITHGYLERLWAVRRIGSLLDEVQLKGNTSKELVDEIVRLATQYAIVTPYTSFLADETVRSKGDEAAAISTEREVKAMKENVTGVTGNRDAAARNEMNSAAPAPSAVAPAEKPDGTIADRRVARYSGAATADEYTEGRQRQVQGVASVRNQAVYQQGNQWRTGDTLHVDLDKSKENVQTVKRFSDEYFALTKVNTEEENALLSLQQDNEEMLIRLRGQLYLIK